MRGSGPVPQGKLVSFMLITALHGLAMAIADAVPGVSGGTIGFILGFYDKFITSLHNLLSRDKKERVDAVKYLLKLGIGWVIGFVLSMLLLKNLFEQHVYIMCSAFIGLTVAAIPFIIIAEKDNLKGKYYNIVWTVVGAGLVVGITMLRYVEGLNLSVSFVDGIQGWQYLYVFVVGFVAISAMMLPGLSGSSVMLIFGVYYPAIAAAHEILHFNGNLGRTILGMLPMGVGLIAGILVSVKGVKTAFEKHRSAAVYCVLGMTAASVFPICVAPGSILHQISADEAAYYSPMTLVPFKENSINVVAFIVGAAVIVGLEILRLKLGKKAEGDKAGEN